MRESPVEHSRSRSTTVEEEAERSTVDKEAGGGISDESDKNEETDGTLPRRGFMRTYSKY